MQARDLLVAACGVSPEEAKKASAGLMSNRDSAAFMLDVLNVACDTSYPAPVRQLGLLTIKNSAICLTDDRLVPALQNGLPGLLSDPAVARIVAVVLSHMIVRGQPDAWFPVYSSLVEPWRPSEALLRCLSFIAQDGSGEVRQAMAQAATLAAHSVVAGDLGDDPDMIRHSFVLVARVLATIGLYENSDFSAATHALFGATLGVGLVNLGGDADEGSTLLTRTFDLERECVRFFGAVCHAVANADDPSVPSIVSDLIHRVFACVAGNVTAYANHALRLDGDTHEGLEGYMAKLLELLEECLSNPVLAKPAVGAIAEGTWAGPSNLTVSSSASGNATDVWRACIDVLLTCGIAAPPRMEDWLSSPNAYLQDEDNRIAGVSTHPRDTALSCIKLLVRTAPETMVSVATNACADILYAENLDACSSRATFNSLMLPLGQASAFWRLRESAMCCVDLLALRCKRELAAQGAASMDAIAQRVFDVDVRGQGTEPVQQARALAFLGTTVRKAQLLLSQGTSPQLIAALLPACCSTIDTAGNNPLLAVAACRLMLPLISKSPQDVLDQSGPHVAHALLRFMALPAATGEILYSALEALQVFATRSLASAGLEHAPEAVCTVWRQNLADPNLGELVVDIFKALTAGHPACEGSVLACLPWLAEVLQGHDDPSSMCVVPYMLDIVARVLRRGTTTAASAAYAVLLQPLCLLTLSNDDSAIVGSALKCIASVIERAGFQDASALSVEILPSSLSVPPGLPGLDEEPTSTPLPDVAAAVLFTVLDPERRESTLMNSGRSLYRLLGLLAWSGHVRTSEVASAFISRTNSLRTDMVLQEVLYPLLRLFSDAPAQAIQSFGDEICTRFFGLVFSRMHFFDGAPLAISVDVAQGCIEGARDLGLTEATVQLGAGRNAAPVAVPVAAFVALGRVLVALHDGEISASEAVDLDADDDDGVEVADDDGSDWSSDSEADDEGADAAEAGEPEPSMGTPQSTSATTSPSRRSPLPNNAGPPVVAAVVPAPKLKLRIVTLLANWVESLGPYAAAHLSPHQRTKLQKLWAKAGR